MNVLRSALSLLKQHGREYAAVNIGYYGLIILGMLVSASYPQIQQELTKSVETSLQSDAFRPLVSAYLEKHVPTAAAITFLVNLIPGSMLVITLPSMVVPFSGLLMGVIRPFMWGLIFSPITPEMRHLFFPHGVTLLLEGQGYILALLAAIVQGKAFLWPQTVGAPSHFTGYAEGFRRSCKLYILVAIVLAIAAIYEACEVLWVV